MEDKHIQGLQNTRVVFGHFVIIVKECMLKILIYLTVTVYSWSSTIPNITPSYIDGWELELSSSTLLALETILVVKSLILLRHSMLAWCNLISFCSRWWIISSENCFLSTVRCLRLVQCFTTVNNPALEIIGQSLKKMLAIAIKVRTS